MYEKIIEYLWQAFDRPVHIFRVIDEESSGWLQFAVSPANPEDRAYNASELNMLGACAKQRISDNPHSDLLSYEPASEERGILFFPEISAVMYENDIRILLTICPDSRYASAMMDKPGMSFANYRHSKRFP